MGVELDPEFGLNGFVMLRYQNKWTSLNGLPWTDEVPASVVTDLGVGYGFKNNVRLNATITNLLEENYRVFYGAPKIGRQLIAKLYYHF